MLIHHVLCIQVKIFTHLIFTHFQWHSFLPWPLRKTIFSIFAPPIQSIHIWSQTTLGTPRINFLNQFYNTVDIMIECCKFQKVGSLSVSDSSKPTAIIVKKKKVNYIYIMPINIHISIHITICELEKFCTPTTDPSLIESMIALTQNFKPSNSLNPITESFFFRNKDRTALSCPKSQWGTS